MKEELKTVRFEHVKTGESFSLFDKILKERIEYLKVDNNSGIKKHTTKFNHKSDFSLDEKVDILPYISDLIDNEKLNKSIEEYKDILSQNINKGKLIADIEDRYHGCISEVQIPPYKLITYIEEFEPVVISKMETVKSDMISRQEVIDGINELLESPFAHSQYGVASKEHAYKIRKEMAEVIINLCVKERKVKSEIN